MINRTETAIGCVLLVAVLGLVHAQTVTIRSIGGTSQLCTQVATECPIAVRVVASAASGGCIASVDIERVRVRSGGTPVPVVWYLAKTDMKDTNEYEFVGDGIQWANAASAAQDFASQPMGGAAARSRWVPIAQAASRPFLDYAPKVHMSKPPNPEACAAGDPKINNDGP